WRFPPRQRSEGVDDRCGLVLRGGQGEVRFKALPDQIVQLEVAGKLHWYSAGAPAIKPPGQWNRAALRVRGDRLDVDLYKGLHQVGGIPLGGAHARGPIALYAEGGPVEFGNIFIRELK